MTFNDNVRSSSGRVGGGRGGGRPRGGMVAGGAGGLGIIGLILFLLTGNPGFLDGGGTSPSTGQGQYQQQPAPQNTQAGVDGECTGTMANEDDHCRMVVTADALDTYWNEHLPQQAGIEYRMPEFHTFNGTSDTACGLGTAEMGPFYCPGDESVYLDTSFYGMLDQLGAQNASLAQMYILAHEWGHHIQNQAGFMEAADRRNTGAESDGVRLELQADCLAGMFIGEAANTVDEESGETFIIPPTREQMKTALDAAAAVGDDHIARMSGRRADPSQFSHGTSEQRMHWFTVGYQENSMQACNTFEQNI